MEEHIRNPMKSIQKVYIMWNVVVFSFLVIRTSWVGNEGRVRLVGGPLGWAQCHF